MTAKKLLLVLIHQVLDDEQATDVVKQRVLHSRMELDRVWVASIIAEGVVHLEHLLAGFSRSWLFHSCDIARRLVPFFRAENARLQVLLSVHIFSFINLVI